MKSTEAIPLVGQPFTVMEIGVPVNVVLRCNCGGDDTVVTIRASTPGPCPSCGKILNALFNPASGQTQFRIETPKDGLPS